MGNVEKVIYLEQEIELYRDIIKKSQSDTEIKKMRELIIIKTNELNTLKESLEDDELVMLDHHYTFESQPLPYD